jgi:hypothetical protein
MLIEYIRAVNKDWIARMSGPAAVILAFLGVYLDYIAKHGRAALWIAAAICFVITSYRVWGNEHKALLVEREKNLRPEIRGEIEEVHTDLILPEDMTFESDKSPFEGYLTIKARIVNIRPIPTTISVELWVQTAYGSSKTMKTNLDGLLFKRKLHEPGAFIRGTFVGHLTEDMSSLEAQGKFPLTIGNEREGWLRAIVLRAENPILQDVLSVTLEVKDAYGGTHNIISQRSQWRKTGEIITERERRIPKSGL